MKTSEISSPPTISFPYKPDFSSTKLWMATCVLLSSMVINIRVNVSWGNV
ncbi:hypothetical protein H4J57_02495 [Colwellia sp. BRX8-7]|nr:MULTISPECIES: hypothetical protein [unclassified Colwellia]MBA6336069.1 hypothetical protein [Colwellia sp. BRX8-7]MBA6350085.1 hypothetical protein [Colwellia sp. BRX8-9]MBA6362981.1 hypothetical protein [Colwellia sp. BRX8-8]MBA6371404.1 hypothetical protein [Colwellia sp. BRX8-4]